MRARRAPGALQQILLEHLWNAGRPMTTSELRATLAAEGLHLAATTVYTVVARLVAKGDVERRQEDGTVRPVRDQAKVLALSMAATLERRHDRAAVLRALVDELPPEDRDVLRASLVNAVTHRAKTTTNEGDARV